MIDSEPHELIADLIECREDERRGIEALTDEHSALYDVVESEDLRARVRRTDAVVMKLRRWSECH
jgi:hypothetical protein